MRSAKAEAGIDVFVCVPATLIAGAAQGAGSAVQIGAEDCRAEDAGPFTGDRRRDAGATSVILGHSERRQGHHETDAIVAGMVKAACRHGLASIVCLGETQAQRRAGQAVKVAISSQRACRRCPPKRHLQRL